MAAASLLIVCDFNAHGGTQTQVLELLAGLNRDDWSPRLCTLNLADGLARRLRDMEVPVQNLALRGALRPRTFEALRALVDRIREDRVRLVHGFLQHGNVVAALAARSASVRYLTSVRNLELSKRPAGILLGRWAHASAFAVTFNSRHVRDLVSHRESIPRAKTRIIGNGVRPAPDDPVARERARSLWPVGASPRLLCPASLLPKKGHRYLLEALSLAVKEIPSIHLVMAGEGPERSALESRAREMGLAGSVRFAGYREDVRHLMSASDMVVLSSLEEGLPNVLLEAMAAGIPQVATSVGGTPEAVDEGVTGYLVPPRDPVLLAERIVRLARDGDRRAGMSKASKERVATRFAPERLAREHEALYAEALGAAA